MKNLAHSFIPARIVLCLAFAVLAAIPVFGTELLEVKPGKTAIVREAPNGDAPEIIRLSEGTIATKLGEVPLYYSVRLNDGTVGWSYKGNFVSATGPVPTHGAVTPTKESLLARTDLLQIVVLDVEVGDAALILCPAQNGIRDVILIDTGENDADRISKELVDQGFVLATRPITRFIATHYDFDHIGAIKEVLPWVQTVYDHGNNNVKSYYLTAVSSPGVDRRTMTLNYDETFSGGVRMECVAVNRMTDFDSAPVGPSVTDDNPNSIATVISFEGFDYFTAGDLTFDAELSLSTGVRNCDVYHANHHGSRATSSALAFVTRLDPEVTVASNGSRHGHPTKDVAERLITQVGSAFFQTNINPDNRAHHPDPKFIGDTTDNQDDDDAENEEGATGTIRIVVDPSAGKYYVIMPNLPLSEGTFPILVE